MFFNFGDAKDSVHFFARPKKRTKKDARAIWSFGLLKADGNFQKSLCSNSENFFVVTFSGAQQMPMGKEVLRLLKQGKVLKKCSSSVVLESVG